MPANMLSMENGQDKTLVNDQLWKKIPNIAISILTKLTFLYQNGFSLYLFIKINMKKLYTMHAI